MTDRTNDQKWARHAAAGFEGLPLEAILVGIREWMWMVDWPRAIHEAKRYQLDIEQEASTKRQESIHKQVDAALAALQAEADTGNRINLMARYFRLTERETAEWKKQDDIRQKREELWKK